MAATQLLSHTASLGPADAKSYRHHRFRAPAALAELRIRFEYDPGGVFPHSLVTLTLFDPTGFRGAAHRFAPRQTIELRPAQATPGFRAGPLPAGEWRIEVDVHGVIARPDGRGTGYALSVEGVPLAGAPAPQPDPGLEPGRGPRPATAGGGPPRRRWLRGELHLHSEHSDGRWTTDEMAARARTRGLDYLFLTDHNTTTGVEPLRRQLGSAVPVHPGIELTTYRGHALALGAERWIDWRVGHAGRRADDVARDVREQGAVFVVAHPDAPPDEVCTGCRWTHADFDPGLAHAVEVWGGVWNGPEERNPGCLALWREWLNAGHRLTATGATDAHGPEDWEGAIPLTWLLAEDATLPALLDALRAGRSYVSSGPTLSIQGLRREGSPVGLGETLELGETARLAARCWAAPPAELRLVADGRTVARQPVAGVGSLEATPRAGERWYCAELWSEAGDALLAVTSPVYLR